MSEVNRQTNGRRVEDILRDRICSGFYQETDRLPSEKELAEEFEVSRTTIRTALASLSSEHLISREQGHGTMINTRFANSLARLNKTWEFTKIIAANGKTCTLKPVNLLYRLPTNEECRQLRIKENRQVISIDRLFLADRQAVIHSNNIIPVDLVREPATIEKATLSIVDFVDKYCGEKISYGVTEISSSSAPWNVAAQLQISLQASVIRLQEMFFSKNDQPLVIARSYVDTSKIKLQMLRYLE